MDKPYLSSCNTTTFVFQMYAGVQEVLVAAGDDDSVALAVITGAGEYYCSGNDLSNFLVIPPEGPEKLAAEAKEILRLVEWHLSWRAHVALGNDTM